MKTRLKKTKTSLKEPSFLRRIFLGDPGATLVGTIECSWRTFSLDFTINFHHEHSIVPTSCRWVSEDGGGDAPIKINSGF